MTSLARRIGNPKVLELKKKLKLARRWYIQTNDFLGFLFTREQPLARSYWSQNKQTKQQKKWWVCERDVKDISSLVVKDSKLDELSKALIDKYRKVFVWYGSEFVHE